MRPMPPKTAWSRLRTSAGITTSPCWVAETRILYQRGPFLRFIERANPKHPSASMNPAAHARSRSPGLALVAGFAAWARCSLEARRLGLASIDRSDNHQALPEWPLRLELALLDPDSARAMRSPLGSLRTPASSTRRFRIRSDRRSFPFRASRPESGAGPLGLRHDRAAARLLVVAGSDSSSCSESRRLWNPRRRRIRRPQRSAEDRANLAGNRPAARQSCHHSSTSVRN